MLLVIGAMSFAISADPALTSRIAELMGLPDETDHRAAVDYGPGPAPIAQPPSTTASSANTDLAAAAGASSAIPAGGPSASTGGVFGAPISWPVIPIHVVLLPDGRVMSYGTNAAGAQGAELIYDVWDPSLGTGTSAHTVLPNATNTDIFCSAQSLMLTGDVLTSGGDLTVNDKRNSANNHTEIFTPSDNTLSSNTPMTYARWYATLVTLPDAQLVVFGGRQNVGALTPIVPATTPELYNPLQQTWTVLTGATSTPAFGANWWYPRAFVAPGGNVFVLDSTTGRMFWVSTTGSGRVTASSVTAPVGNIALPSIPFAPGKLLSIRANQIVVIVDYTTSTPVVTQTNPIDQVRFWANGTVLADGRVLVTGGSAVANTLTDVDYTAEIWDPNTGNWTAGAHASKPRLYHSNALLLPDATVLTGGGGAPGPLINLNAEIYYPPYLYAADGTPAVRPTLSSTGDSSFDPGATLTATVGPTDTIERLTMVRMGSSTHSNNVDQRFIQLPFTQSGQTLTATLPADSSILLPGYYMLFAINTAGVPSVALTFPVTAAAPANFTLSPTSVPFGVVATGSSGAAHAVTLTNEGGMLAVSTPSFTGPGAAQFSQTNNCGSPVAAAGTCTINVVYSPTAAGYTWATLSVLASGLTQTATVNGTGSVPFGVSPATVSFGKVPTGTATTSLPVTVNNLGTVPLPISGITLTGSAASQFSQTNNCAAAVPGGSSCTINVVFQPAATGYIWAKLNVSAPGATHSSTVSGTGT